MITVMFIWDYTLWHWAVCREPGLFAVEWGPLYFSVNWEQSNE